MSVGISVAIVILQQKFVDNCCFIMITDIIVVIQNLAGCCLLVLARLEL